MSPLRAVLLAATLATSSSLAAESEPSVSRAEPRWRFTAELDPLTFGFGGYGVLLSARPAALPNVRFGASSFSFKVPDFLINTDEANRGFRGQILPSVMVQAHWFFFTGRHRLHAGPGVALVRTRYSHADDPTGEQVDVSALAIAAQVGYQFYPFERLGLFIEPWLNVTAVVAQTRAPMVSAVGKTFRSPPLGFTPLLHVGYEL